MKKIYCTSTDGELFGAIDYKTRAEAIEDMRKDLTNNEEFFIGEADPITFEDVKNICGVITDREMFVEQMMDDVGEVAEGWLELPKEDWEELQNIVARWIWRKDKPAFFRVKNIEKFGFNKKLN